MNRRTRKSEESKEVKKVKDNKRNAVQQRVFFLHEKLLENGNEIRKLRHPGSGKLVAFVISKEEKRLYEIIQFDEPHRSWLIDDSVSSNGKCYMTIPFDITFLVLYYLRKHCTNQACPLEQLNDPENPYISQILIEFCEETLAEKIADVKTFDTIVAYKYNKDKCLAWLALKTRNLAETLKNRNIHCGSSAVSSNYVKSEKINQVGEQDYIKYACGIIGNYIEENLLDELLQYFSIKKENICSKRKSTQENGVEHDLKKFKIENDEIMTTTAPNESLKEKEIKIKPKEKALAKAAKGTKSIASFFKR